MTVNSLFNGWNDLTLHCPVDVCRVCQDDDHFIKIATFSQSECRERTLVEYYFPHLHIHQCLHKYTFMCLVFDTLTYECHLEMFGFNTSPVETESLCVAMMKICRCLGNS